MPCSASLLAERERDRARYNEIPFDSNYRLVRSSLRPQQITSAYNEVPRTTKSLSCLDDFGITSVNRISLHILISPSVHRDKKLECGEFKCRGTCPAACM